MLICIVKHCACVWLLKCKRKREKKQESRFWFAHIKRCAGTVEYAHHKCTVTPTSGILGGGGGGGGMKCLSSVMQWCKRWHINTRTTSSPSQKISRKKLQLGLGTSQDTVLINGCDNLREWSLSLFFTKNRIPGRGFLALQAMSSANIKIMWLWIEQETSRAHTPDMHTFENACIISYLSGMPRRFTLR